MTIAARRRWAPSWFLYGCAALHGVAIAAVLVRPGVCPWALGALVFDHLLITAVGLWPRSHWLGPNLTRLPDACMRRSEVAITIDDGPDPDVTPRVLDLLARRDARATFFCIGERVERHPELARDIVRRGHDIENHSQKHRHDFSLLGLSSMRTEIGNAQESITRVTGVRPRFFRAPAGLRNPFLEPALCRLGLRLASWTRRGFDTVNGDAEVVYRRLSRSLRAGDVLLLHDGHCAGARTGAPVILEVLPRLLDALEARQLRAVTLRAAFAPGTRA